MKSYTQFIKEVNTTVSGNFRLGSSPSKVTSSSISSGIDSALKNRGQSASTVAQKGKFGLSGGASISMSGSSGSSSTLTPTKTKIKPIQTKDPKKDSIKPTTTVNKPNRPSLVSSPSSSSTPSTPSTPSKLSPLAQRVSDYRMGRT